jgi:hypothetical protein
MLKLLALLTMQSILAAHSHLGESPGRPAFDVLGMKLGMTSADVQSALTARRIAASIVRTRAWPITLRLKQKSCGWIARATA